MESMSPKKKMTKTTTTTTKTSYVPNDIIIDILSWVPAKSLLRLRWACKYWFHLITRDHDFIMKQFHRSHNPSLLISKPFNPHLYYPYTSYPCKIFQRYLDYSTTTTSISGSSTTTSTSGSFPCGGAMNPILSGIFVRFQILGSCHGLILFSYYLQEGDETILCIWNPCTKEYKYLPKPLYGRYNSETFGVHTNFGLGYDHSIQDYKVMHSINSLDGSIDHVNIYTLRTNSWRYIGSFATNIFCIAPILSDVPEATSFATNIPSRFFGHGVFMNGALYFIHKEDCAGPAGSGSGARIFSLDFEKETYGEISNQPHCLNYDKDKFIKGLTMFEGSLCLTMYTLTYYKIDDDDDIIETWRMIKRFEMWVMKKDYNMNNNQEYSWSKLCEHYSLLHDFLQPLRFTKEGEILLLDSTKGLFLFDPKNNKLTIHKVYKFHRIEQAETSVDRHKIEVVYIESLVYLNSGTYIDEQGDYMHYWKDEYHDIDEERDYMHYY